jgi:hypothetical protein
MRNPQPALEVTRDVMTLTFPDDGYALDFRHLSLDKYGSPHAHVTARHDEQMLHCARFDLLNQREQELFHQRCVSMNGSTVIDWQTRLLTAIPMLHALAESQDTEAQIPPGVVWHQAMTAQDFLRQDEPEVSAHVKDLIVPGCITNVSAPRASGKSLVALYVGVALAAGGVFRDEQLTQRRVLLVDRDNARALVRKRLGWLGAHQVTSLKVLTRETAPPLTDKVAWDQFPVEDYDVVIVDSLGAATEGISEKEGRQTQEFLATLKDLARRGPAILCLDNTNKAGTNYRGRGEKADAVDILYECRNITGWVPPHGNDWWEQLPDFGEHTWQERASRRKGQAVMRVAFIPTKFRLGIEPEPFVLEIDARQEPWTLTDVTAIIATAGERAAEEASRQERAKIVVAEETLVRALTARAADTPLLKSEAEALLRACGLRQRVARTLLESGGNHDLYPAGRWVIRQLPHHPTGKAFGIYLVGEEDRDKRSNIIASPSNYAPKAQDPFVDRSTPHDKRATSMTGAGSLEKKRVDLSLQPGCSMTKGDPLDDEHVRGSPDADGPFVTQTDASALSDDRSAEMLGSELISARVCPQCGCDALMHCATYWKCPVCSWKEDSTHKEYL